MPLTIDPNVAAVVKSLDSDLDKALKEGITDGSGNIVVPPMNGYADDQAMGGGDHNKAEETRKGIRTFLESAMVVVLQHSLKAGQ